MPPPPPPNGSTVRAWTDAVIKIPHLHARVQGPLPAEGWNHLCGVRRRNNSAARTDNGRARAGIEQPSTLPATVRDLGYTYNGIAVLCARCARSPWPKGCVHVVIHHRAYVAPLARSTVEGRGEKFRGLTDTAAPNWKLVSSARRIKLAPMPQKLDEEERGIRVIYFLFPHSLPQSFMYNLFRSRIRTRNIECFHVDRSMREISRKLSRKRTER